MIEKIFDIHIFFGKSLYQRNLEKDWLKSMEKKYPLIAGNLIPCKPYDYFFEPANKAVEKINISSPKWQHSLRVDPWRFDEAIKMINESNSKILFIHPFEEQIYPTHANVKKIIEQASGRNMLIMIACGYLPFSHSAQVFPLIKDFPKAISILTHGAQINVCGMHMEEAFEIFENYPNTIFETSGIYREDYIEKAIKLLGPERVVFGSASPVYDLRFELERIKFLKCEQKIKEQIINLFIFF